MKNKNHKIISLSNQESLVLLAMFDTFLKTIYKDENILFDNIEKLKIYIENSIGYLEDFEDKELVKEKIESYQKIDLMSDLENIYKKLLHDNKYQFSHLKELHNLKKENTENKIIVAIEELKKENEKLSLINISKKSNVSYTTIKKYKNFIEDLKK